jgi:hypothetical protein
MLASAMTFAGAVATESHACACGAVVTPRDQHATMNHEVALVHWDGSTENILMQLALNASTDNVALVVPTPAPATVTSGDKATFAELNRVTAPQTQIRRHWKLGMWLSAAATPDMARAPGAPNVVNQVRLGPLEATTLAGGDLGGLQKWLNDNGYSLRPAVSDALGPYVKDGWAFVAIRLASTAPIVGGLDPVRMTFPSSRLVYPMRLSVAAPSPQEVTVFTLSDHRQQRTDADAASQSTDIQFAGNIAGSVHDPLLLELAGDHGAYLTKLSVKIATPQQISSDFAFGNAQKDDAYRAVEYIDRNEVIPIELIVFVAVVAAAVIVLIVVLSRRRRRPAGV